MLSTLLSQIQTQLLSKRFLLASLLPVFLFLFASGAILWLHYPPFRPWISQIDNLKDGTVFFSVVLTLLLTLAYLFSVLNSTLLEWLEGHRGPLSLFAKPLYRYQKAKLDYIEKQFACATVTSSNLSGVLKPGPSNWLNQLVRARIAGARKTACDAHWPRNPQAKAARNVILGWQFGIAASFEELHAAVVGLRRILSRNSANLETTASRKLNNALLNLQSAILFSRDRNEFDRIRLYNERQFTYPGEMSQPEQPSPHNILSPTRMGNIGSTIRSYAVTRYNLDLDIFWSRLQNAAQADKDYFGVLQDMKVQVDCLVSIVWLSAVFTLVWTPVVFRIGSVVEFLVIGSAAFVSLFVYSLACDAYRVFADMMRGTVDMYRFKLLSNLHIPLPGGSEEEKLLWGRLGNKTGYARSERILYKHSAT